MIAQYWSNLNERERWLLSIGVVFVIVYLFYLLIYSPLTSALNEKSKQLIEKQETLSWIQQVRQQAKNQTKAESISSTKLLALIGEQLSAPTFKPFPYQLQQTGTGDIQLSFNRIPYKQFLTWFWTLNNTYLIKLKQFSAEKTDTPGVVKVFLILAAK